MCWNDASRREWKDAHPDYFREYARRYYAEHKNDPEFMARVAAHNRKWRAKNRHKTSVYNRRYNRKHLAYITAAAWLRYHRKKKDPAFRAEALAATKRWNDSPIGKKWWAAYRIKYRKRQRIINRACRLRCDPLASRAHGSVARALRKKIISRGPCQRCGDPKSESHHADYTKPMEVMWLCRRCHIAVDQRCKKITRRAKKTMVATGRWVLP